MVLNDIEELFKQYRKSRCQIEDHVVEDAISVVENLHCNDSESIFYILSALNLLNAAIKRESHKAKLSYDYIKGKAVETFEYIHCHHELFEEISFYYAKNDLCLFVNVFDVIFSFHQVKETPTIIQASQFEPIEWKGIRLQRIAQPLFLYAKENFASHYFNASP